MSAATTATTTTRSVSSVIADFNRGALTSLFVPAPSCTDTVTLSISGGRTQLYFAHGGLAFFDTSCLPVGSKSETELAAKGAWETYYYSPAVCPQSWSQVATFTSSSTGFNKNPVIPIGPETTAVLCCPPGYSKGKYGHICASTITVDQEITYIAPKLAGTGWDRGDVRTTTVDKEATIQGDGVPIWWQSSDSAILAAAAAQTSAGVSGSLQTLSTPTSSPSQSSRAPAEQDTGSGMSNGAKIGLGVGIPIVVLIALAIAFILFRRRRAKKTPATSHTDNMNGNHAPVAELMQPPIKYELRSEPIHEMEGEIPRKP